MDVKQEPHTLAKVTICEFAQYMAEKKKILTSLPEGAKIVEEIKSIYLGEVQDKLVKSTFAPKQMALMIIYVCIYEEEPTAQIIN